MGLRTVTLAVAGALLAMAGCGGSGFRNADRAQRLMALAAGEAGQIESPKQRLTAQLNVAELQINNRHARDAMATLVKARDTLRSIEGDLDDQARLAGWISLSELARRIDQTAFANAAVDRAIQLLEQLDPPPARVEYVRAVAQELRILRGKAAAAALLRQAGPWAAQIEDMVYRRQAYQAIASDLFLNDDDEGGLALLRQDPDAAWRTATLTALARQAVPLKQFGKSLGYDENFSQILKL